MSSFKRSRSRISTADESKSILLPVSKTRVDFNQGMAIKSLKSRLNRVEKESKDNLHFIDVAQTLTPGNTATIGVLTPIGQGDTDSQRSGDSVLIKRVNIKFTLIPNASALVDSMRLIVFRWKGSLSGTPPATTAVLQAITNIDSPLSYDYRDQMTILMDKRISVSNAVGNRQLELNKAQNAKATFTDGSTTSWNAGAVFFLFLSTDNVNKASVNYYSRISYVP